MYGEYKRNIERKKKITEDSRWVGGLLAVINLTAGEIAINENLALGGEVHDTLNVNADARVGALSQPLGGHSHCDLGVRRVWGWGEERGGS